MASGKSIFIPAVTSEEEDERLLARAREEMLLEPGDRLYHIMLSLNTIKECVEANVAGAEELKRFLSKEVAWYPWTYEVIGEALHGANLPTIPDLEAEPEDEEQDDEGNDWQEEGNDDAGDDE